MGSAKAYQRSTTSFNSVILTSRAKDHSLTKIPDGLQKCVLSSQRHIQQCHPILNRLQSKTRENQDNAEDAQAPLREIVGEPLDVRVRKFPNAVARPITRPISNANLIE